MSEVEAGTKAPSILTAPQQTVHPNTDYSWASSLSEMKPANAEKVLEMIGRDIALKEKAMQHEYALDRKRIDYENALHKQKMEIEERQLNREDYFNRWGLVLSFGVVVISIAAGSTLILSGQNYIQTYGGIIVVVIGVGLGSGSISKIAEKIMGRIYKKSDKALPPPPS